MFRGSIEDHGGVGRTGRVQCETTGHPAEDSDADQGSTPEQRALGRLVSGESTLRLAGGRGWGHQGGLGIPGFPEH